MPPAVRLLHFSDVHLTTRPDDWRLHDWFNKRLAAWVNLRVLGRGHRFRHADRALAALLKQARQKPPDRLVFSGDATALGFESEMKKTAGALGLFEKDVLPGLAVPGNHDYCTPFAETCGAFERCFAPWLVGERVGEATYPFAQRVGPLWLIGLNSSTGNRLAWDASGAVGAAQRERLAELLRKLDAGPRILVTHYPVCLESGKPERKTHGLRDVEAAVRVAVEGKVCLWLHGHRHHAYHHAAGTRFPFAVICTGSATQTGLWSYGDYTIAGSRLQAVRQVFDSQSGRYHEGERFELELPGAAERPLSHEEP